MPLGAAADTFEWSHPSAVGFAKAMAEGDQHATRAGLAHPRSNSRGHVQRAIRAYEQAAALSPREPEPHYRIGLVIYTFHISPSDSWKDWPLARKALTHWQTFEKLAPLDPRLGDVLFNRSLASTKLADDKSFRAAVVLYARLLQMSSPDSIRPPALAIYLGNKAELHMMLGELDEAIELYERALKQAKRHSYGFGLAVALDRDSQGAKARQIMRHHMSSDKRMRAISEGRGHLLRTAWREALLPRSRS